MKVKGINIGLKINRWVITVSTAKERINELKPHGEAQNKGIKHMREKRYR